MATTQWGRINLRSPASALHSTPSFACPGELKPLAYGIKKLSILATVVDEKVGVDDLTEKIQDFEDFVQSVDIAAFNKV